MSRAEGTRDPAYLLYRSGSLVSRAIPEAVLFPLAELAGTIIAKVNRRRRTVVRRNIARATATDVERVVDEAFRSYARYWVETLRIPKPGAAEIRSRTTAEGMEHISRYLDHGQGVVFVTGHVGSYDVAGAWLASHGWRIKAIAEELEPPALFEMFARLRRSVGVEVLPLGKAASARSLLAGLREGAAIGLVADRDISGSGIEVDFLGEKTMLPDGPAILALRTGSPIVVGALYQRPGRRYHGVVLDPIEVTKGKADPQRVRELSEEIVRRLETLIRRDPGQWHLFQPNWPSDPGYRHLER